MLFKANMVRLVAFLLFTILFAGAHTLFMRMNLPQYGQRMGTYLDDISYTMLVALVLVIIFSLPSLFRKFCLFFFVLALGLIVAGEWWNFEFYRDYIHYASLGHAADWREITSGFEGFESRYMAILGLVGFLSGAFVLEIYSYPLRIDRKYRWSAISAVLVLAVIPTAVYTEYYINTQIRYWQNSVSIPLNYKNPVLQLIREKLLDRDEIAIVSPAHIKSVNKFYQSNTTEYPFFEKGVNSNQVKTINIILVVLESVRTYETIPRNGIDITPNFNRISEENFTPRYFYANSNQTIKAEIALLCGVHDFLVGTSMSASNNRQVKTNCLPSILKRYGYQNYWFHGAKSDFFNRDSFLPLIGFDELHDRDVIEESFTRQKMEYSVRHWGVEDQYTFEYAMSVLESSDSPFLAEILTVSNHHPFVNMDSNFKSENLHPDISVDLEDIYNRYQHMTYYSDKALGQFWSAFEKSSLYENTIVVISGDHGIWLFPDDFKKDRETQEALQYEAYLRLPLTIYFPGKKFSQKKDIVVSQIDVAEILMGYLGLGDARAFQSNLDRDYIERLLEDDVADVRQENPVFSSIGDNYFYRNGSLFCYPPTRVRDDCDDYLFRCVENYNKLNLDKKCVEVVGDVLGERPQVSEKVYGTRAIDTVVDYFRKSIYYGNMPEKEIINPSFSLEIDSKAMGLP